MLLSKEQADAAYWGMVALNKVGARLHITISIKPWMNLIVYETLGGEIFVNYRFGGKVACEEVYANQNEFFTAYGITL